MVVEDAWLLMLYVSGALAALLAWRWIRWQDDWTRYLSFGAVLLLMCVINRFFYIADYLIAGTRFSEWPFTVEAPEVAVFKGEVISVLGILLTVVSWRMAGGNRMSPSAILDRPNANYRVLRIIYFLSICGLIATESSPVISASLGQLLPTLLGLGIVCSFLLPLIKLREGFTRLIATALMSVPFLFVALGKGMKEEIIVALLPTVIAAWRPSGTQA